MTRKVTLVAVVVMLAVGTSAAFALGASPGATDDAAMAQETTTVTGEQTTTVAAQTANVTFADQTSNGTAVVVERVVVPEGGFVVIHEAQRATGTETTTTEGTTASLDTTVAGTQTTEAVAEEQYTAGPVLGNSTYLEPGVHEDVTVQLDQPLEESQVLIAMPHLDTNDNQQYEFPEADDPYVAEGGAVIDWAQVTVEDAGNQTTTAADGETTTEEM